MTTANYVRNPLYSCPSTLVGTLKRPPARFERKQGSRECCRSSRSGSAQSAIHHRRVDPRNPDAAAGAKTTRYNFVLSERLVLLGLADSRIDTLSLHVALQIRGGH